MAKMRAIDAAVRILEKEGVRVAFGVPGAAINPPDEFKEDSITEPMPTVVEYGLSNERLLERAVTEALWEIGKWDKKAAALKRKLPNLRGQKRRDAKNKIDEYEVFEAPLLAYGIAKTAYKL